MSKALVRQTMKDIEDIVLQLNLHETVEIQNSFIKGSPENYGYSPGIGVPVGQKKSWRKKLADGRSLHLRQYDGYYTLHFDAVHPEDLRSWIKHIEEDFGDVIDLVDMAIPVIKRINRARKDKKKQKRMLKKND